MFIYVLIVLYCTGLHMSQTLRVDLDNEFETKFKEIKKARNLKHNTEVIRQLIGEEYNRTILSSGQKEIILSVEDKTFLEVIAQDHWNQFHSFEELEVKESIVTHFKKDSSKPKNSRWLTQAIEFVCSLKRN